MREVAIVHLQLVDLRNPLVYVPYVYGVLRACAEQFEELRTNYQFLDPLWRLEELDAMVERLAGADVVGFSVYVWNERNSHRLARALKERNPGCLVVFGGPQVPNRPCDYFAAHPWVDLCVHGEGEATFAAILREHLKEAPDWSSLPGISFHRGGEQVMTRPAPRLASLDFPSPYIAGHFQGFLQEVARQMPHALLHACLETTRGCPYSCAFCDWGSATMTKLRRFAEERVRAEMDWMAEHRVHTVILNDSNFGILPRDVELARYMADLKARHGFPRSFLPLGFAKNNKDRAFEINRIIQEGGLDASGFNVNFSLQSLSQAALNAIGRQNIPLDNYRHLSQRYAASGYELMPDLIFPLPGETLASFQEGYADLASWEHVKRIMIYPCIVLPNAPMAAEEYRRRWGLATRLLPLPSVRGLQTGVEVETEMVETVVSTRTLSEKEAAEARAYVALVDALELYGLTREVRRYLGRRHGIRPHQFYTAFLKWQLEKQGTLFAVLCQIYLRGLKTPEEPMWMGQAQALNGMEMFSHKAITYDALARSEIFRAELAAALYQELGLVVDAEMADLLRYQADLWLLPQDGGRGAEHVYRWDWVAYLEEGSDLVRRPLRLSYRDRAGWPGWLSGLEAWLQAALMPGTPDTFCVRRRDERQVLPVPARRAA
ncbi:MAG TPA: cobalamin-dependent protein [Candidatus Nitrosotenuis sp.]|nr:cobalamin-dependent protein [Candidatus Nitrosotenuis sp.]